MAEEAYGTTFGFTGGGGAGFAGLVKNVALPEPERRFLDVTHLLSTGGWDEFEASVRKGAGEMAVTVLYDPGEMLPLDGAAGVITLTFSDAASSTLIVSGFVQSQTLPAADIDGTDALVVTFNLKLTGPITGTGGWLS